MGREGSKWVSTFVWRDPFLSLLNHACSQLSDHFQCDPVCSSTFSSCSTVESFGRNLARLRSSSPVTCVSHLCWSHVHSMRFPPFLLVLSPYSLCRLFSWSSSSVPVTVVLVRLYLVPGIPWSTCSFALCQMAGAEAIPKTKQVYWKKSVCVICQKLIWRFLNFHLSASARSIFVKRPPPDREANMSSMRDSGYWTAWSMWLSL